MSHVPGEQGRQLPPASTDETPQTTGKGSLPARFFTDPQTTSGRKALIQRWEGYLASKGMPSELHPNIAFTPGLAAKYTTAEAAFEAENGHTPDWEQVVESGGFSDTERRAMQEYGAQTPLTGEAAQVPSPLMVEDLVFAEELAGLAAAIIGGLATNQRVAFLNERSGSPKTQEALAGELDTSAWKVSQAASHAKVVLQTSLEQAGYIFNYWQ